MPVKLPEPTPLPPVVVDVTHINGGPILEPEPLPRSIVFEHSKAEIYQENSNLEIFRFVLMLIMIFSVADFIVTTYH